MSEHDKIKEILLNHKGKKNAIKSVDIADKLGIKAGASKVIIRKKITETIILNRLPVASTSNGYYLLEDDEKDLKRYQKSLQKRSNKIMTRKVLITQYFFEYYEKEPLEITKEVFDEDLDISDEENED